MAIRPKTLPAAVSPVVVATALAAADDRLALGPALAALVAALLLQIGSNLANDYFDHVKGADGADRLGPTRVTAAGLLPPQARAGNCGGGQLLPPPLTYPLARFLIYLWSQRGAAASAGAVTTVAESSSAAAADALRRSGLFAPPAAAPRGRQWWETKRPRKR